MKFDIVANKNMKQTQMSWKRLIIERINGVKFGALVEHIWNNFDLVLFQGQFGVEHLRPFGKYDLYTASSKTHDTFSAKLFLSVPCDSRHKSYFL